MTEELKQTKKCSKCGIIRPIKQFHKKRQNKDGLHSQCRFCICRYWNEYYQNVVKPKREGFL